MNWKIITKSYGFIGVLLLLFSSCCVDESDSVRLLTDEQANWIPNSGLKSFLMESECGVKESFVLSEFSDTIISFVDEQCGCTMVFQRKWSSYQSTFANHHQIEMTLNTLNYARLDIGLNWNQQASWDFTNNENIPHAYTSNDYPNPSSMRFVNRKTINGCAYSKVLTLNFAESDVAENGIVEADFIPKQGIVHYKLRTGISYYRKPMP